LTANYTRAVGGGAFEACLKFSGFDFIIAEGQAQVPGYLHLENGSSIIRMPAVSGKRNGRDIKQL
jgi:aldehyde:ferredoxin oxidoreductase